MTIIQPDLQLIKFSKINTRKTFKCYLKTVLANAKITALYHKGLRFWLTAALKQPALKGSPSNSHSLILSNPKLNPLLSKLFDQLSPRGPPKGFLLVVSAFQLVHIWGSWSTINTSSLINWQVLNSYLTNQSISL